MKWLIASFIHIVKGFFTVKHPDVLIKMIKDNNFKSYVEIGVFKGDTINEVYNKTNLNLCAGIDKYTNNNRLYDNDIEEIKNLMIKNTNKNIKIILEDSIKASKKFKNNSLDLVFIDGDHSYEACLRDIDAWYPKIKKGGILAGHNFELRWFGVIKAVDERFSGIYKLNLATVWSVVKL